MSQYELARMIYESENGLTVDEMKRRTGNVESTVRTALYSLVRKGYIVENEGIYSKNPDKGQEALEKIRPTTLSELRD